MNKKNAEKIIRQRIRPHIFDFCYITTRAHLKAFIKFQELLKGKPNPIKVLDLGCGQKPFENILKGTVEVEKYIGVDFDSGRSKPDIIGPIDDLPLKNNLFDAIIATEVLEHTLQLEKAIDEMRRVAKNGAFVYISTPFMFGEHGTPYDFQRITRYKYFDLFKNDEIIFLKETNNNLSTLFFLSNVTWEIITVLKMIPILTPLVYFLNNTIALLCETMVSFFGASGKRLFSKKKEWFDKLFQIYFYTMPGGYDLIVQIKK